MMILIRSLERIGEDDVGDGVAVDSIRGDPADAGADRTSAQRADVMRPALSPK
ncbi:MAG: hypothetical protein IPK07_34610 [Deltaproteobacteria bacterium]|nr:hypothetical protein [Deltaproteobacteria bacterium]